MKDEKKLYWETNTPFGDCDYTVFESFEDAKEAICEYIAYTCDGQTEEELEKEGIKFDLYIKPLRLTEKQFKNILEEA